MSAVPISADGNADVITAAIDMDDALSCSAPTNVTGNETTMSNGSRKRTRSRTRSLPGKDSAANEASQLKRVRTRQTTKMQTNVSINAGKLNTSDTDITAATAPSISAVSVPPVLDVTTAVASNSLHTELDKMMNIIQRQQDKIADLEKQLRSVLSRLNEIAVKQQDHLNLQQSQASEMRSSVLPLLEGIAAKQQEQLGFQQSRAPLINASTVAPAFSGANSSAKGRGRQGAHADGFRPTTTGGSRVVWGQRSNSVAVADGDNPSGDDSQFTLIVHRTLNDVNRRKRNIIISGLPEETETEVSDRTTFLEFAASFLQTKPALTDDRCCQRIGRPSLERPRRLLVHLESEQAATELLREAPRLRQSDDDYISRNVFINADPSPSTAKFAYEARRKRRETQRRRVEQAMDTEHAVATSPTGDVTGVEAGHSSVDDIPSAGSSSSGAGVAPRTLRPVEPAAAGSGTPQVSMPFQ